MRTFSPHSHDMPSGLFASNHGHSFPSFISLLVYPQIWIVIKPRKQPPYAPTTNIHSNQPRIPQLHSRWPTNPSCSWSLTSDRPPWWHIRWDAGGSPEFSHLLDVYLVVYFFRFQFIGLKCRKIMKSTTQVLWLNAIHQNMFSPLLTFEGNKVEKVKIVGLGPLQKQWIILVAKSESCKGINNTTSRKMWRESRAFWVAESTFDILSPS